MADDKVKRPGLSLTTLRQGTVWRDLQNVVANLVHCNITILDPQGKKILDPSRYTDFCKDQRKESEPPVPAGGADCVFQAFESCMLNDVTLHSCRHKIDFSTVPLRFRHRVVAVVILGPFLLAEKKFPELEAFSREYPLRERPASRDQIRGFKVLTGARLTEIQNFLQCLFDTFMTLSFVHVPEIEPPGR